jgi:predicted site-specific integrase-resolvase
MKLSDYAKLNSIHYKTAWSHWKQGKIQGKQLETGTVVVFDDKPIRDEYIVTYARVSSSENKANLETQSQRLIDFCNANGWKTHENITEIGSGLNDNRSKLNKILELGTPTKLVVEHKDRLTRFGFKYLEILCKHIGCEIVVINEAINDKEDLIQDFISVITSFCARIYGQRRTKRNTEKLIAELTKE